MQPEQWPLPRRPAATFVLLGIAWLIYLALIANLSGYGNSDAAGNGIALVFIEFLEIVLWILLALLLIGAATHGDLPVPAALASVLLLPASGVAAIAATELYSTCDGSRSGTKQGALE